VLIFITVFSVAIYDILMYPSMTYWCHLLWHTDVTTGNIKDVTTHDISVSLKVTSVCHWSCLIYMSISL